jgi:hypothetical protein
MTFSTRAAAFALLLVAALPFLGCYAATSKEVGEVVAAPSLLPDEGVDAEPKILSVTSNDPSVVSVSPPDPKAEGYRGYTLHFAHEGETSVQIQTDQRHYDVALTVRARHNF